MMMRTFAIDPEEDAEVRHPEGDELADAESEEGRARIAAEEFEAEADDRVADEIDGAGAAAALEVEPEQEDEQDQQRGRLEELGREDGKRAFRGGVDESAVELLVPGGRPRGEADGDGGGGEASVAAAVEEAAEAAAGVSERNHGAEEVGEAEDALLLEAAPGEEDDDRQDESAVEHESALVDADDVGGARGEFGLPVLDHVGDAAAEHTRDHQGDQEVREVIASGQLLDERPAEEEPDGHARAVGLEMEESEVDQVREHSLTIHVTR